MSEKDNEKTALMPRLRFPGFREAWVSSPMSDLYSFKGNNSLSRDKLNYNGGTFRSIHYGDIHTKFSLHFRAGAEPVPYINDGESHSAIRPENYCMAGDMVFADASEDMADIGKAIEVIDTGDAPLVSGLHTILARPNGASFVLGFGAYLFSSEGVRRQIQHEAQGAKVLGLSANRLANVQLHYPTRADEQQKIVDCLSSLDERITAESRKLDALKAHKKGLMQRLFPRKGETVPRLRFPEFRKAGAWAKVTAGQLFSNRTERGEQSLPIYSVTMTEGLVPRASLDRRIDDIAEAGANKTVRKGDIAYNMMRMWQGALGVAPEDCMVSPAYIVLEPQVGVNPVFFYFLLKRPEILQVLTAHSRGLTEDRLRLYYDDFAKVPLRCPSLPEQERIAACLSSLDDSIVVQSQQIDALRTHKNGLVQRLFPVSAEVRA
ncbi:restriction endonuclease subunit S (plasmid) [Burkholderia vietnamiensis]|uniref:restriction endonuclease subunit S n=1 Tax=Burkholderia vietnamiensis TaxID=60552 RepID=UPI002019C826|nr:restriction endonuclease subunit S [Burkholderia vietnamiensis]MCO1347912.1 restriction endonuclease subunit S [Burkholderia vietnamiensis]MCO1430385.1 restriction endonuclease subunit S [Burkholderia vietnamiensis]UQN46568.1 restriction endonuclease subunit S [Burkholderia vietnamiensis]